ncbi:MAG TPA: hypothetical protein VFE30_13745 [Anaeromyxobacteraceae bacterium]|jgi:hypothetical protein|nr:hypothetical protein [Anaeromyxobacteraceae bacterium]
MADRIAERFKNLERPRRPSEAEPAREADARIGGIERPSAAASAPTVAPSHMERFRPPAEPTLDTVKEDDAAQPFIRCLRCQTDNSPYARTCSTCEADLGTREQQVFNERLWEQRKKEKELEDREAAVREAEREAAAAATEQAKREMAAEMARHVGEVERERLDRGMGWGGSRGGWGDPGGGFGGPRYDEWGDPIPDSTPYGLRLLRLIKSPAWRIGVIVGAVALPLLLLLVGRRGSGLQIAGFVCLFAIAALFSPPGYRYRRRRFWDW